METYSGIFLIMAVLFIVLLIGTLKARMEWLVNFFLRGVSGMLFVYFINMLLTQRLPGMETGYNLLTFLTSAILGFPGVVMLYGINFYMIL